MYSYVLYYNIDKSGFFNAVSAYLLFEFVAICNFFLSGSNSQKWKLAVKKMKRFSSDCVVENHVWDDVIFKMISTEDLKTKE